MKKKTTSHKSQNFAANWDDLGKALGVSRRAIQDWRKDDRYKEHCPQPRADGRHDVHAWLAFMARFGLKRADENLTADETHEERRTVREWKEYREKLICSKLEREIAREDGTLLVASELEVAVGQMLAGIGTALDHLPASAARFLVGVRDVHVVQTKLQSEIDAVKQRIHAVRYLDNCLDEVAAELGLDENAKSAARETLRRIGRRALNEATGFARANDLVDEQTKKVANKSTAQLSAAHQSDDTLRTENKNEKSAEVKKKIDLQSARKRIVSSTRRRKA